MLTLNATDLKVQTAAIQALQKEGIPLLYSQNNNKHEFITLPLTSST